MLEILETLNEEQQFALINLLEQQPDLENIIVEWPPVINSLIDTGKINWLTTSTSAYINTGWIKNDSFLTLEMTYVPTGLSS